MDEVTSMVIIITMPLFIHNSACNLLEHVYKENVALVHDVLISVSNIEIVFSVTVCFVLKLPISTVQYSVQNHIFVCF